ncbi:hypothetical protein M8494_37470 [Serratia ureilytica]
MATCTPKTWCSLMSKAWLKLVDMPAIQRAGLEAGRGSARRLRHRLYWQRVAEHYKLDLTLVNDSIDQTFHFMPGSRRHHPHGLLVRVGDGRPADARRGSIWRSPTSGLGPPRHLSRRKA